MTREQVLINHIQEYLDSGMIQYEACYLNKDDLKVIIEALKHQKVGKWKKIKAIQYFVGGYSCSICQTFEEQPLEYCNCCGARMEV